MSIRDTPPCGGYTCDDSQVRRRHRDRWRRRLACPIRLVHRDGDDVVWQVPWDLVDEWHKGHANAKRAGEVHPSARWAYGAGSRPVKSLGRAGRRPHDHRAVRPAPRGPVLAQRLPAWGKTLCTRASATPKVHIVDSGLAARLLGVSEAKLATLDPTTQSEFGHLLKTFVVGELRKQASSLDERVTSSRGCANSARRSARDSSQESRSAREPGPTPTSTGSTFYRSTDSGDRYSCRRIRRRPRGARR